MRDRTCESPSTPSTPTTPAPSPANQAARAAASYVRSTPNVDEQSGLSATGLDALAKLQSALAWELR